MNKEIKSFEKNIKKAIKENNTDSPELNQIKKLVEQLNTDVNDKVSVNDLLTNMGKKEWFMNLVYQRINPEPYVIKQKVNHTLSVDGVNIEYTTTLKELCANAINKMNKSETDKFEIEWVSRSRKKDHEWFVDETRYNELPNNTKKGYYKIPNGKYFDCSFNQTNPPTNFTRLVDIMNSVSKLKVEYKK